MTDAVKRYCSNLHNIQGGGASCGCGHARCARHF